MPTFSNENTTRILSIILILTLGKVMRALLHMMVKMKTEVPLL